MISLEKVKNYLVNKNILPLLIIPIVLIGIVLRIICFVAIPIASDSLDYMKGAEDILIGIYTPHREPGFSLYIVPFLLLFKDSTFAIKSASFTSGILLIITSFLVFRKASIKFFERDNDLSLKSTLIALSVSLCISVQYYLVYNTGRGLREETISVLLLLIFYYIFVKENENNIKSMIIISFLITALNLIHLTAGIFSFFSVFSFVLISKTKYINFKIPNTFFKVFLLSFVCSLLYWFIFSGINFGNPFFTFVTNQKVMNGTYNVILSPWNEAIETIRFALIYGIMIEFSIFYTTFGVIFGSIIIFSAIKFYRKQQVQFLVFLIVINLLYISIFIAYVRVPRFISYFFPFMFYIGFLGLVDIIYKKKETIFISIKRKEKTIELKFVYIFYLLLIYFIVYSITQITAFILHIRPDFTAVFGTLGTVEEINRFGFFSNYMISISYITSISLVLIPIYVDLNNKKEWKINRNSYPLFVIAILIISVLILIIIWHMTGEKYSPNMR